MTNSAIPQELTQSTTRATKPGPLLFLLLGLSFFLLGFILWIYVHIFITAYHLHRLQSTGLGVTGSITNLYKTTTTGRHGQGYFHIDYSYPAIWHMSTGDNNVVLKNSAPVFRQDYQTLHLGQAISVRYDPTMPSRSALII